MKRASYGSWLSPLASDRVVAQSLRLSEPRLDGDPMRIAGLKTDENAKPCNERVAFVD